MAVRDSDFYIGLGSSLVIVRRDGSTEVHEMYDSIRGLSCSALHTTPQRSIDVRRRRRTAASCFTLAAVFWDDEPLFPGRLFATGSDCLIAAFITQFGWLVRCVLGQVRNLLDK